ncbi:DUF3050 domain-containing protein [Terriglobus roseus]|uniref:DUF3050 domain-containing protein n=1 Tax=Terriglobus roseus TaxID=392734 RepID=A0A1H4LVH9_9BACT|nr:DUF3050 domain-containing protein [Terriglobus roseus]SEB74577.1 Protein of unknown function [Terriglobus roseus]
MNTPLHALEEKLKPLYARLATHPLYASFRTIEDLRAFMEAHVFAVWDFMSLLKALQRGLTCVEVPWLPGAMPESRRLVNEIVLGEESDIYQGQHLSHFELYRLAMQQCGASTVAIDRLLFALRDGADMHEAVRGSHAPDEAKHFVGDTFHILGQGKLHAIGAAFTFGREDLIPEMFKSFVRDLNRDVAGQLETFIWYLERHIEVDGEEHGPMALRMIAELCGDDATKWAEAEEAAIFALESRLRLWDGIAARIA